MAKTRKQIIEDLKLIDIVAEILDARIPIASQNPDIKEIIKDKKRLVILNKCDLACEKENKKSAKAVVHDSCTLFLLPQLFAGVRKLREVVFCEKLPLPSIVRS